ncbi:MAG: hypothetical protein IJ322_05480, partial [Clostridia bacterium]|nr:hypothetical protein [Clostridia bacterium]
DYRSGHNEAVLKTVWVQAHGGSNPSSSANGWRHPFGRKRKQFTQGELLFFFFCWCASLSYHKSDY